MSRLAHHLTVATLAMATLCAGFATAAYAAQDEFPRQTLEVIRFNEDGDEYLVKVTDPNFGTLFRVQKTEDGSLVKAYVFNEDDEDKVMRRIERVHKQTVEPHSDSPHPKDDRIALLAGQRGKTFYIFATYGAAIGVYDKIDVIIDKNDKPAQVFAKQTAWHPSGRYVVIVYHQKVDDMTKFAGDFLMPIKFSKSKLPN